MTNPTLPVMILLVMGLWAIFFLRRHRGMFGFQILLLVGSLFLPIVTGLLAGLFGIESELAGEMNFSQTVRYNVALAQSGALFFWPFSVGVILVTSIMDDDLFTKAVIPGVCLVMVAFMATMRNWVVGAPYLGLILGSFLLWTYVPALVRRIRGERKLPVNVVETPNALGGDDGPHGEPVMAAAEEDLSPIPLAGEECDQR